MKILQIKDSVVSIASEIQNAYIDFSKMTVSIVAIVTDVIKDGKPVIGYGFHSNGRYAQAGLLRERFLPRLIEAKPENLVDDQRDNLDPFKIWDILMTNEKPGGHGDRSVAVGVLDMAVWDAVAKIEEKPLYKLLAERFGKGKSKKKVFVYAAGGYYYPGKGTETLVQEMQGYLEKGYRVVKMKIGAASLPEDMQRIEAVLRELENHIDAGETPGSRLAVDANGRFDLSVALAYARELQPLGLFWYEEAGDPLDYHLQNELSSAYDQPFATGENLFSHQDVANLLRYGGLRPEKDYLQMDPALAYGLVEYSRMLDIIDQFNWSHSRCVPHGGHQFALHLAAGLGLGGNESYPGVFQPFGGFADETPIKDSLVGLTDHPGVGFEAKSDLINLFNKHFQ
ncbi:MAG: mandelate racemase/muconate lactonizing enzyme family protein [Desulfofustis sp.]|nr:mandelate racemase/muconate lactonizing enzyme family protein [Desulfofustis sp.]